MRLKIKAPEHPTITKYNSAIARLTPAQLRLSFPKGYELTLQLLPLLPLHWVIQFELRSAIHKTTDLILSPLLVDSYEPPIRWWTDGHRCDVQQNAYPEE
jgi:hypothetical protein